MGGFHDILSKVISSIRRFVDHNIWSMRRLGDYDVWLTTTYRLKFVELRRNSSKFSRKRTRTESHYTKREKMERSIFRSLRATNSVVRGRIWPNFKLIQALMYVIINCKYEKDPIKNNREKVATPFFKL